jgi:hypothetical protein
MNGRVEAVPYGGEDPELQVGVGFAGGRTTVGCDGCRSPNDLTAHGEILLCPWCEKELDIGGRVAG